MKKKLPAQVLIYPASNGWCLRRSDAEGPIVVPTLDDVAVEAVRDDVQIALALPLKTVLLERMRFPTTDRDEILGMLQLRLEKSLPYPPEEVTSDFSVVSKSGGGSFVLAAALPTRVLEELCEPLRARRMLPFKVGVHAVNAVAACPKNRLVLLLYKEQEQVVIAVVEQGRLSYAQSVPAASAQILGAELPQLLLAAELDGVPSDFRLVCLDQNCADLEPLLGPLLGVPVENVDLDSAEFEERENFNLVPSEWIQERRRVRRSERLRKRLSRVGAVILAVLLVAIAYLVWLQVQVNRLERQLVRLRPELETVRSREDRWKEMGPAIDPTQYPVEIMFQIFQSLPSEDVRITKFTQQLDNFTVEGEAPSAGEVIQFIDTLRDNPELRSYSIESGPPTILPNDHAKFRVFAKR